MAHPNFAKQFVFCVSQPSIADQLTPKNWWQQPIQIGPRKWKMGGVCNLLSIRSAWSPIYKMTNKFGSHQGGRQCEENQWKVSKNIPNSLNN